MNPKHKAPLAFLSGVVVTALLMLIIPSSGLRGTLTTSSDLQSINFSKTGSSTCSVSNCDIYSELQKLRAELQLQKEGMDTMTSFTSVFTAFTNDFNVFTNLLLEQFELTERYEKQRAQLNEKLEIERR